MKKVSEQQEMTGKGKTVAVDFDGVIHGYSSGWNGGTIYDPPVEGAKEALEALKSKGYRILIFSTRNNPVYRKAGDPDQDIAVKEYLDEHEIPYDKIHKGGKPMAEIYIDDRAIGFQGDWDQTLKDVSNFKVWNK